MIELICSFFQSLQENGEEANQFTRPALFVHSLYKLLFTHHSAVCMV